MKWYLHVLKKKKKRNYATFQGRATRKEYWMFVLFNFIIWCVLSAIELITDMPPFFAYSLSCCSVHSISCCDGTPTA